ncbi:ATP-binding protein [Reichenbachiella sp. MALMAid0571]|uniref:sensor histidine kinase n=1 Tax=Reichenbachiella sp. MALMAid0571 TaxID=3143939 RepID=UPI0032DEC589
MIIHNFQKINSSIIIAVFTLLVSVSVMIGWLLQIREVLSITSGGATMKFNTALLFFLAGMGVLSTLNESKFCKVLNAVSVLAILFISALTLLQYFSNFNYNIDTLFVDDPYSTVFPGRMSPASAFCFLLIGIVLWGIQSKYEVVKRATQFVFLTIILISLVAILAYILQIPGKDKSSFINSMAFHTSFLFFWLAVVLSLKNASKSFKNLILGNQAGSRLIRVLIPFNFVILMIFGVVFLHLINNQHVEINFGFTIYTVSIIFISISYIIVIAFYLNKSDQEKEKADQEKERFQKSLQNTNQELASFKQALDSSSLVATTDANGVITYVNDKFCEISKYNREELLGQTHKIINSGFHSKEFFKELWQTIKAGDVWIGGIKNRAKDSSFYWVHTAIVPFKNEKGEIYQYLAIRQDITKLALLSTQYENLKLKNKEIEQFAYIASHDLQEPLRTVSGMADVLQKRYYDQLDENGKQCLEFIQQSSFRMNGLIRGLLDYSRIGRQQQLQLINCNQIIETLKEDLSTVIADTNTTISAKNLPELKVYSVEFRLLFQNLISNAIKFRKKDTSPKIDISVTQNGDYWQFSIADNGIGIAPEHSQRVFAIFQQLHNRSEYEGTGIGLAHCEKIVHLHGGTIWLDSKENIGSTFHFTIAMNLN